MLVNQLILENGDPAKKIVFGLQDCLGRIVLVLLPIKVRCIAFLVHVSQLKQALLTHLAVGHIIYDCLLGVVVAHIRRGNEAGFGAGQSLKEIRPVSAFVRLAHSVEARAELLNGLGHFERKQVARKRLFDDLVPLRLPCVIVSKFRLLVRNGRCRRRFEFRGRNLIGLLCSTRSKDLSLGWGGDWSLSRGRSLRLCGVLRWCRNLRLTLSSGLGRCLGKAAGQLHQRHESHTYRDLCQSTHSSVNYSAWGRLCAP